MGDSTPEVKLAAAILAQAFSDMTTTDSRDGESADTAAVAAIRFLTDRAGTSAQWRNLWCAAVNLDGDRFAARVRKLLDGEIEPTVEMRGRAHISAFDKGIARARERWARIKPAAPKAPPTPARPPTIKRPSPPPAAPVTRPTIEPEDVDLRHVPDDPFFVSQSGHVVASRPWSDGERSRILGPLPPFHSKAGQLIWQISQRSRSGKSAIETLGHTTDAAIRMVKDTLPQCDVLWSAKGERLPDYQLNAGLRLYLKQLPKAA
ncbi:hypothetical protein H9N28_03390 [Rhodobacter capsulatus]|uniref:hypothetical protein n=1 Tax=Rhodobacter capsulatus TaxID=1061 RepID=UPI0006DC8A28|nr:hypothetical protein [Rhodobacter capsulatus]KQB15292.1 hypothetical protein AP073_14595 [Rhodobacter capsulatus]KQB16102.1 hypothetical protein AP071_13100 [Rhodobacter capsulatus]PZX25586.1 hypothetical protein LY44_01369 [Rhodobacter capsulatus]QNR63893.1 hypothetical protein H9N28_03390 [Rhodobacter capsulatus]